MKTLKFKSHLVPKILSREKTSTWRLFDEKDLQMGDQLELINSDSGEKFAEAEIINLREKELGQVQDSDFENHEKYLSKEDMFEHYREYYGSGVELETIIKMIDFKLL